MTAPNTCENCGERLHACECGDFRPPEDTFDDPEEMDDEWDD